MAHKELSHQDFHCLQMYVRIYLMSEFPDFTLYGKYKHNLLQIKRQAKEKYEYINTMYLRK